MRPMQMDMLAEMDDAGSSRAIQLLFKSQYQHILDLSGRSRNEEKMRPMQMDMLAEMDDAGSSMAMDVDELEAMEILSEGGLISENKLADAEFFNKFEDDFDDADIK
ncbi:Small acidic protein 1 [Cardamine amara subsp. amara]|uniref:Small acidic protein 1 n=1 Tax=Cardamine amara subsp. amara TaxID=228776 RepID=A0ABD1BT32_CARAN